MGISQLKYMKVIFTTVFLIVFICVKAQTYSKDNLRDSVQKYIYNNPTKAKDFAYKYLRKSESDNDDVGLINALNYLGTINNTISYTDSAYYFYDKAIIKAYDVKNELLVLQSKMKKAGFLYQHYDFNNSLIIYNEALLLANKLNLKDYKKSININIARLKYETGNYDEALKVFKENYDNNIPASGKATLDFYIALTYQKLNQPDSSLVYINKGLLYSKKYNDKELEIYFLNELGSYYISKNKFDDALSKLNEAKTLAQEINSYGKKEFVMFSIAKLNTAKGDIRKSIDILHSILNDNNKQKTAPEELSDYYKLLAENYKKIDSLERSNFYYEKYFQQENKKTDKKFNTIQDLHSLDLKKVNSEKESYLKQRVYLLIVVIILLCLLTAFIFIYRKKSRVNDERFTSLMNKIEQYEQQNLISKSQNATDDIQKREGIINNSLVDEDEADEGMDEVEEINSDSQYIIKDEKITEILEKLEKLEKKKYYLRQDFTLHSAAKRLKTNTAYLSKIVNNELGKTFSTYLNELRINYIILELKNNSKLRAYSVNSIAEEIGYKSADSFTKYFKIATGLTPSVYIKKINDLQNKNKIA